MWTQVVFSDECRMALGDYRRGAWTRGARKQRTVASFPRSMQFWAAISMWGSTSLIRSEDKMNSEVYMSVIKKHLLPLMHKKRGSIFQQV